MRIAPVADVPGPIQKNYFFFLAAFLVAFFFAAFFAILGITPSVACGGSFSQIRVGDPWEHLRPSWLGSSSPPSGRPRQVR